jgi:hypothetical protein
MRVATAVVLVMLSSGCEFNGREPPARSERERDSILGESRLPGAPAVRGALEASDSAAARNERYDSVAGD